MIEQIYLTPKWDPNSVSGKADLGVMAIKGYSTLPRALELEPHHQMQVSVRHGTFFW